MFRRALVVLSSALVPTLLAVVACSKEPAKSQPTPPPAASVALKPGSTLVTANEHGFTPSSVTVAKGKPATLTFLRTTDETCATAVAFPEIGVKKDLPLNQPVEIEVPTTEARKLTFQCGMGMFKSSVVIQ
jgi:hypothetical protein